MTQKQLIFRQLFESESSTYTYLLADAQSKEAILIDTVREKMERDLLLLEELGLKLKYVLDTHVHADHITAAGPIAEKTGAQSGQSHLSGVKGASLYFKDGETLKFGPFSLKVLSTPGHTNSCTCFYVEGMLFTGDTLLIRACGRTDFQEGSAKELYHSIQEKLYTLPDETLVYPGHDYKGLTVTTIGEEKKFNSRNKKKTTELEFVKIMSELKLAQPKKIHEAVPANLVCGKLG